MGSSIFHRILRTQSHSTTARIIPFANKSFLSPPPLPPLTSAAGASSSSSTIHHLPVSQTTGLQIPLLAVPENGDLNELRRHPSKYFPAFSVGFFLNPNPSTGLVGTDIDGAVSGDTPTIWADSVKKKRKRKMNKHKLRKLRKRNSKKRSFSILQLVRGEKL